MLQSEGLKFHGYFYPNTRYFLIARFNKTKTDLSVQQRMFVGDENISQIQVGIIAHGNEINIDHCVFYKLRNTAVFFQDSGDGIKTGNSITNSIIYGAKQSVWTAWPDKDFKFENNVDQPLPIDYLHIILEYLGLNKGKYAVIFCTPGRAEALKTQLKPESYQSVSRQEIGLPLGVRALAVERKALPGGTPFQTGGGTTRLISPCWVVWADAPNKFEASTSAIVNVIAFARALRLIKHFGNDAFRQATAEKLAARHGTSPSKHSKRSFTRSSPSVREYWVHPLLPMM